VRLGSLGLQLSKALQNSAAAKAGNEMIRNMATLKIEVEGKEIGGGEVEDKRVTPGCFHALDPDRTHMHDHVNTRSGKLTH
jgi:hypothetical protein